MVYLKSTAFPKNVVKRIAPVDDKYQVSPWGIKWRSNTFFIIFTIGMGMFSDLFLYSLIVPIIPFMLQDRVGAAPDQLQTITSVMLSAYALASMIMSPIVGFLADRLASTRQIPFLIGLAALMAATVLLAVGKSVPVLITARALQGASSAAVWTIGLALCLETVGPQNMGKTVGSIFSVLTAGTLFAPTIGGLLYEKTGYTGVFGVAVGILVVDTVLRLLVIEKKVAERYQTSNPSSAGSEEETEEIADENTELVPKTPDSSFIIPAPSWRIVKAIPILACLRNPSLLVACLLSFGSAFLIGTFDATIPIIAREWFDFKPLRTGLLFLPLGVVDLLCGPIAGWGTDRYGTKPAAVIGFGVLGVAMALLRIPHPGGAHMIAIYCVILGACGIGLSIAGTPSIVEAGDLMEKYHKANPELFGENGPYAQLYGMTSTMFSLGLTLGPLAAGGLKDGVGYANMNTYMAGFSGVMALAGAIWIGRPLPRLWKGRRSER